MPGLTYSEDEATEAPVGTIRIARTDVDLSYSVFFDKLLTEVAE